MIRIRTNTRNRFILRIRRSIILCCRTPTLRILRLCCRILSWSFWSHGFLGARPPLRVLGARPSILGARSPLLGARPSQVLGARPPLRVLDTRPPLLAAVCPPLLGARPSLLGARPSLLGARPSQVLGARPPLRVLDTRPPLLAAVCPTLLGALRRQIALRCSLRLSLRSSLLPLSLRLLAHRFLPAVGVRLRCYLHHLHHQEKPAR
jgi:hypothetical protein